MFRLFPNFGPFLSFGARTPDSGAHQALTNSRGNPHECQHAVDQAMKKSKAESIAFARLSAEFRSFAGSARNAQSLVIGLRDGSEIILDHSVNGSSSGISFAPPTGRMGYSNVSIALSLARQYLAGQGIKHPTTQQLQAALVGGTITGPQSGNSVRLEGILQLKVRGMGWGKIANFLGIKLGSIIGEVRPVPAVLQPRINAYSSHASRASASMTKMPSIENDTQHAPTQTRQAQEKNAKQSAL